MTRTQNGRKITNK